MYYKDRENIPERIIVNIEPTHKALVANIIGTKIIDQTQHHEGEVLEFALNNAQRAMTTRLKKRHSNRENLDQIAELLDIVQIKLIELYDNSHISGSHAIGAMIAFGQQGFCKERYRKFNIKDSSTGDDLSMMREVLTRRLSKLNQEDAMWPDLLIIDGGTNQLAIAMEILSKLNLQSKIRVIALAKGAYRNKGNETIFTDCGQVINLNNNDQRLKFLQVLRDEIHSFAIKTYRAKHMNSLTKTQLINIPGIGVKKSQNLLSYFGSIENIKNAKINDLSKVNLIDIKTAEQIYKYFHPTHL
jgi:excinuclease ABC subunit C